MPRLRLRVLKPVARDATTPVYNIGAVSRLTGLAIWTVRWIEKHKLVTPTRTGGNQRLFSDADVDLLHSIRELMEEGVNLAGVRVILKMRFGESAAPTMLRRPDLKNGARRVRPPRAEPRGR